MPQITLLPDLAPDMHELRIAIRPCYVPDHPTQLTVYVSKGRDLPAMPVWVGTLVGIETDFLSTFVSEVTMAWAHGNRMRDVQVAALAVRRQARAHREAHEF
jgi:hypothetical protein